jgi:alpha-L-rhamnosidase
MRITHCEVEHLKSPVGFQMDRPVFSWRAEEAEGTRVTEARLRVFEDGDCLLDTGFASCVSSLGYAADLPLKPRTAYTWTVAARTDAGDEAESPVCIFETGKRDEPWTGR